MTQVLSRPAVLVGLMPASVVRDVAVTTAGAGLVGLCAQISLTTPLSPVPFTLQTLAVLLVGAALGSARGVAAMLIYLIAGSVGVPWFAGQTHGLTGPAVGYVVGFVVAAAVAGALAERGLDRSVLGTVTVMVAGNLMIYAVGVTWLAHEVPSYSVGQAIHYGLVVFLASDTLKIAVAAALLPLAWRFVGRSARHD